ncbi:hypothetical protein [Corynebacterium mastitidis]|uniref:hypothetical protein n=1 Tax=Corynebacterium mastitidis TaxID=161890 RepID=UPI0012EAF8E2|nr:hypothetical protein [Corynebacterium mastitidis]
MSWAKCLKYAVENRTTSVVACQLDTSEEVIAGWMNGVVPDPHTVVDVARVLHLKPVVALLSAGFVTYEKVAKYLSFDDVLDWIEIQHIDVEDEVEVKETLTKIRDLQPEVVG